MKEKLTQTEKKFVDTVWKYYEHHGRHNLPWRKTRNPYRILVSEVMLQQTQVARVIPKYSEFLKQFPTIHSLANARLGEVLRVWQGLGYNRRAKMLHECAREIIRIFNGKIPRTHEKLVTLKGVGAYTSGAVCAFAYNIPVPVIETNIRSVYLHHFFRKKENITDEEIVRLIERTLDYNNPREWYYALMDYGAYIKKKVGNQNVRSKHYSTQPAFRGSDREIRGAIIRSLTKGSKTHTQLCTELPFENTQIITQTFNLMREGLIIKKKRVFTLP